MAFVHGYHHDIFISYSHRDNIVPLGGTLGWVECFRKVLEDKLSQRMGIDTEIWFDNSRLQGNHTFNTSIETALTRSALLIALTSPSSINSDYCRIERQQFVQQASLQQIGLCPAGKHRIFNILLNNIPFVEWPLELGRGRDATSGFELFEKVLPQDPLDRGKPSEPCGVVGLFNKQMDELVAALHATLVELQKQCTPKMEASTTPVSPEKQIFFAEVPDSMRKYRRNLIKRLKENDFTIITDIPPPDKIAEHDRNVIESLKQCGLSAHLLSEDPGEAIEGAPEKTYPEHQAELALLHSDKPFIWVPKKLAVETVSPLHYQQFLTNLGSTTNACVYKGISDEPDHEEMYDQLLRHMESKKKPQTVRTGECLVDYHAREDAFHVSGLTNFLFDKGVHCRLVPQADNAPEKGRRIYEERIRSAAAVFILFGMVSDSWVEARLRAAQQYFAIEKSVPPHFIICAFPPETNADRLQKFSQQERSLLKIHLLDQTRGFLSNTLDNLLKGIGIVNTTGGDRDALHSDDLLLNAAGGAV